MTAAFFRTLVLFCDARVRSVVAVAKATRARSQRRPACSARIARAIVVLAALACAGCSTTFGAGVRAYEHGRYPEALESLVLAEPDARRNHVDGVRYALYRGLTHLALGDLPASIFWLDHVKRVLEVDPSRLPAAEAGRLASAWAHLPREPGDSPSAMGDPFPRRSE